MAQGKIIGIVAVKGGVGKTTTTSNLGAVLSDTYGKKVLVVDANFSAPNLGLHLGVTTPQHTIHDVLKDKVTLKEAAVQLPCGFDLVCGAAEKGRINPYKLKNRLEQARKAYDVILLDSSPTINEEMLSTLVASDEVIVVANADYPTLSCTMQAIKSAKKKNVAIKGIVLNKLMNKSFEIKPEQIEQAVDVPVVAMLPHDIKVLESLQKMRPMIHHDRTSKVSQGYKLLGALVLGVPYQQSLWEKVRSFW